MKPVRKSILKLRKLKEIRRKNLEKNFLEIQMKGQKQYVFIKENGKAQVVYEEGRWVSEHIRTAVLICSATQFPLEITCALPLSFINM